MKDLNKKFKSNITIKIGKSKNNIRLEDLLNKIRKKPSIRVNVNVSM